MKKKIIVLLFLILSSFVFSEENQITPLPVCWIKGNGIPSRINLIYKAVLFNNSAVEQDYILRIYDSEGEKIGYSTGSILPNERKVINLNDCLVEEGKTPVSVRLIGDDLNLIVVADDTEGERLTAFWLPDVDARDTVWINHLAPERDQFFTSLSVLAYTPSALTWQDANKTENLGTLDLDCTKVFELNSIYPGDLPQMVQMASIKAFSGQQIKGIECFGNWDDKVTFATLPATWFSNTRLIFPHIAYSKTLYWTGLVIGNPNNEKAKIKIRFMDEEGNLLQTQHTEIPSLERIVMLFAHQNTSTPSLPEEIPEGTAWIDVYSDIPLTGFELFGGNDTSKADYMEGIRATCEPFEKGVCPYIVEGEHRWTGIAMVNSLSIPVSATLTLLSPEGNTLETKNLNFNPFEKKVDLLRNIFSRENVAKQGSVIIECSEDGALTGIIVFGDDNTVPRKILGGYEIIPLNSNRMYGPKHGQSTLPKFGVNSPKFMAAEEVSIPTQQEIENEMAWLSSGQPFRIAIRHCQNRDFMYSEWIDPATSENRKEFVRNKQGIIVSPTLINFHPYWNGIGEPDDPIDMNDPNDVQQLKDYINEVIDQFPEIKYYEIFNETFGTETYGMANMARIIDTLIDTARQKNPDILFGFPNLLGTTKEILENAFDKLVLFANSYPETMAKIDVYGIHYYGPWQDYEDVVREKFLEPMANGQLPEKPWIITETGISSNTEVHTVTITNGIEPGPENQASYMVKIFTLSFYLGAEMCMVHSFQSGSASNEWAGYGMINIDKTRSLESCTFRYFTNAVRDFTSVDKLVDGENGFWLFRYNNAHRIKGDVYVAWKNDGVSASETEITLPTLAGQVVKITKLVPENCPGTVGEMTSFNPDELFETTYQTVNDDGTITVIFGEYPVIIEPATCPNSYKLHISTSNSNGTVQNLLGVISGPYSPPQLSYLDLTEKLQDIGVTSIRNNDYYDDSLDIEGIFQCPDDSVYPSWDCDANDDQYYHWERSDRTYSSIVNGGFEPFLRLGGEYNCAFREHDFKGPRENQEDNWIIAAKKMVERYKDWPEAPDAFQYLDIWTEWPNSHFWDRSDTEFIFFWAKAFREIKTSFPEYKVGGPGFLKPTVDIIRGETENNPIIAFLTKLYNDNLKPDWIGFHLWKNDPLMYYRAVRQFRDLLNGTGDFSSVPWAGTNFFEGVEIICDAFGFGKLSENEDGTVGGQLSNEFIFHIMNSKKGAAQLCADFIALQQGGAVRAYYYRSGDQMETNPNAGPYDSNRGQTGLFYGDEVGTPKPSSNAYRLFSMLYREYPQVINSQFYLTGQNGKRIFYLAGQGENGIAILVSNPEETPANIELYLNGEKITANSNEKIKIYRVDDTHNGTEAIIWQGEKFRIPPECTEVIVIEN